jgi:pimeloyl-ACP methyl ester carboxylesterase
LYYTEYQPLKGSRRKSGWPSRPTIVLIHGAGGNSLSWPVEIRRLSGYRVLAFDLPGHGKSEGVALQNMADINRAVFRFLREAGVYSMVLVAHSLGAAPAVDFARKNPDQVKGMALLSAPPCFTIPPDILQAVSDAETYPIGLSIMRQRFFSPRTPVQLRNRILSSLEKQRSTILYSDFLSAARVDLRKTESMIACPTWIACGKQDLITPPIFMQGDEKINPISRIQRNPLCRSYASPGTAGGGCRRFSKFSGTT